MSISDDKNGILKTVLNGHLQRYPGHKQSIIVLATTSEAFFKIKLFYFWDTSTLQMCFLIVQINNCRGDVSDILAKTATLATTICPKAFKLVASLAFQHGHCFRQKHKKSLQLLEKSLATCQITYGIMRT